ncbi:MAG TPA: type I 3-dehydroquinate dehydratase [Dissulfurispiraceae bacterium]|nr:type I 3-dehydroquinate dehydratase [Dissulfurispiraceae bacterium]
MQHDRERFRITRPLIAGVLNDEDVGQLSPDDLASIDLIELRIDLCSAMTPSRAEGLLRSAREKFAKPLLATVRHPSEGGEQEFPDRVDLYRAMAPHTDAVDIEISAAGEFAQVRTICNATGTLLIGSYHNFSATPDNTALEVINTTGRSLGADIVKLALMPQDREDVVRLAEFTLRHRTEGIIAIAMGALGIASRVFMPLIGSLATYASVTRTTAPGQLSATDVADLFRRLNIR